MNQNLHVKASLKIMVTTHILEKTYFQTTPENQSMKESASFVEMDNTGVTNAGDILTFNLVENDSRIDV